MKENDNGVRDMERGEARVRGERGGEEGEGGRERRGREGGRENN